MNEPNPNWVEAPYEQARWTPELGEHFLKESGRLPDGSIVLDVIKDGNVIGRETIPFTSFNHSQWRGEWGA